ncbi:hypothetical protein CDO46_08485 [Pigmentiphaga sp. NML030171]|uniref:VOC family protein n=1 Tax=Pigmentiphaga sp. NML030171 TaxID=2008676 RepID=UPI000B40A703|nr:VOC family protein [Pigmentiphaga sp. NML030171]OVZ64609.1 hypothetical protein CDO46_08485 [Pigmentiphaga sp. NML030171]
MLRFKKLSHLALNVSDLDRSAAFYRDMVGLDLVERTADTAFLSCDADHYNLSLHAAAQPSLKRIAFELESAAQVPVAREVLERAGVRHRRLGAGECADLRVEEGIRLVDPNGITLDLLAGMRQRTEAFTPHPMKLLRLSHAVIRVPDFAQSLRFYTEVMNFRVSDFRHEDDGDPYFAFMRCFPNPFHHSFAIQQGKAPAFFHSAYSVESLDDLMAGRNRLLDEGAIVAPSPGRHKASGSVFQYFADPDGFTVEFTLGMEEFPETGPRQPRQLDKSYRTTDIWNGPKPTNLPNLGAIEPAAW